MKRITAIVLALILLMGGISMNTSISVSAAKQFAFNGSMSKETLRSYASRAVTHSGFIVTNNSVDPIFEEDLRMLRRIGAKYIGRAAMYSWGGPMSLSQIEKHYQLAKEQAEKVHKADPEMILQAGIFEIAYKSTVEATPIPAYVFEAFNQPVADRKFDFESVVFPKDTKDKNGNDTGIGCWGNDGSGVPDITQLETKMYFYYQITKYIDAGFEAFHMGQAEKMMLYRGNSYARHWDELLTKAREYAKTHARRGIALFDCHTAIDSAGIKVGDRLVFDIQGAGAVPNETVKQNGAMMCEITTARECWLSWVGRSEGGIHPLGFEIESNFTIIELDNYGGNGNPGVSTPNAFYNWGFDDITWFAVQPEWYRNQFIIESDKFLKSNCLDKDGKQQYFLQPSCRRVISADTGYEPQIIYTPGSNCSIDFVFDYAGKEKSELKYSNTQNKFLFVIQGDYRANRNSDACPNGFGQEDTIREIFLGKNAAEDPELLKVTLPDGYSPDNFGGDDGNNNSNSNSNKTDNNNTSFSENSFPSNTTSDFDLTANNTVSSDSAGDISRADETDGEVEESTVVKNITKHQKGNSNSISTWILVVSGILAALVGCGTTFFLFWRKLKKPKEKTVQA